MRVVYLFKMLQIKLNTAVAFKMLKQRTLWIIEIFIKVGAEVFVVVVSKLAPSDYCCYLIKPIT